MAVSGLDEITVYSVDGGEPRRLAGQEPGKVVRWSADGQALFLLELAGHAARVFRRNVRYWGAGTDPGDQSDEPAGLVMFDVWVSGDGKAYAYPSLRRLSNLYVLEGLR